MNFKLTTLFGALLFSTTYVQAQDIMGFQSQFGVGSAQIDEAKSIVKHNDARYVYGRFSETMDFDPSEAEYLLDPLGTPDLFLVKYNPDNTVQWGFNLGRIALSNGLTAGGLAVDQDGNIYITGSFSSLVDFDPSDSQFILTSEGGRDAFLAKYSSDGELIWVEGYGTSTNETSSVVDVDSEGNVVFSLMITSEINVDHSGGETIVTPIGSIDAVAIKVDENGSYLWSHAFGTEEIDDITEIKCSDDGKIAIGGQMNGVADPFYESDMYMILFDTDENMAWDYNFENFDQNNVISTIRFGEDGESIYVGGRFQGTTQFDPSNTVDPLDPLFTDPFFAKYSINDGSLIWAKYIESSGIEDYLSDLIEAGSALMVIGSFDSSALFDPEDLLTQINSNGGQDIYLAAYDRMNGDYISAESAGGTGNEHCSDAYFDGLGVVDVTGNFNPTVKLDESVDAVSTQGFNDVFVARFTYETSLSNESIELSEIIKFYPNPTSDFLYLSNTESLQGNMKIEVLNIVGQVVLTETVNSVEKIKLDVSSLNTGLYIMDITFGENRFSEKFVKN